MPLRTALLDLVLRLRRRGRLPLHVAGRIGAAAFQWLDVIDDEPRARPRGLAGCRWTAWNALRAAGLRAIRPSAVRAQLPHLFVEDSECPTAERRSDQAADRGALRGAERGLLRLVEAHAESAASRRQSEMTSCRIIMLEQSAVCVAGNRARWVVRRSAFCCGPRAATANSS